MPEPSVDARWLADYIGDRSARGIASAVTDLIRRGEVPAGTRLPTVRGLATELGVSPATVADAWSTLRRHRVISAQRRRGTIVVGPPSVPHPVRYERIGHFGGHLSVDLAIAAPDPALLPPLEKALAAAAHAERLNDYARETITPRLRRAVEPTWPFPAEAWLVAGGGYEGVQLACQTAALPGDRIAVEDPTGARLLDIFEALGAEVIPVACDEGGPIPAALAEALATNPAAFVYQPRAHTPCGHSLTRERAAELAALLAPTSTLTVEDDGLGEASATPAVSIGEHLPGQTVLIRSYSKSHGPDLRIAVLGGAEETIERVRVLRSYGTGWTSRILQDALAHLLEDADARAAVDHARTVYTQRRERMAEALAAQGVVTRNSDGLMLWVPVADESAALVTLAAHGVAAAPGSRYQVRPSAPHIRIATGQLPDDLESLRQLADLVVLAARRP
ncbi:aminotransferase class I/II-fold pyridoxal phosphate-dependent enzyme [Actinoallomurus purpureus]|uniref:aminotransferase-like domain-containing protein n=1 Tax=Actinoallomurus purpureus TaxID=478114 RepID=UPI002092E03B|nr:aminotransferase class I/II-fold pyridoxal phosphate-dependent enzyme [Actinoallomurus purpureus]MCO6007973.1 aminotransferase class I/II-fold pyridoxal phosphate-dependent enzyme [Actinoallomurus purpureus]